MYTARPHDNEHAHRALLWPCTPGGLEIMLVCTKKEWDPHIYVLPSTDRANLRDMIG